MLRETRCLSNRNLSGKAYRRTCLCAFWTIVILVSAAAAVPAAKSPTANLNSPTGTRGLIMVDKVGGYIRFFDPASFAELTSFDPSPDPGIKAHELAISPDHKTAYATVYGDGVYGNNPHPGHTIAIIDLASQKMVGSIDLSPNVAPHGIQVDAAGKLYVTCDLSHKVLIIDPQKRAIEASIDTPGTGHWIAVLPDASKLYVAQKDDKPFISVIDLKLRKVVGSVPMPNGTEGIVASPDGKTVLAADHAEPYVAVISTATDTVVERIQVKGVEKGMYKIFYSPDGKTVLTCVSNGQVNIFDAADLHAPQRIVKLDSKSNPMGFAFSADGKTVLVGNHGEGTASLIDLKTATVLKTFPAGKGVETLAYY